jgi:hypothetical protein
VDETSFRDGITITEKNRTSAKVMASMVTSWPTLGHICCHDYCWLRIFELKEWPHNGSSGCRGTVSEDEDAYPARFNRSRSKGLYWTQMTSFDAAHIRGRDTLRDLSIEVLFIGSGSTAVYIAFGASSSTKAPLPSSYGGMELCKHGFLVK